MKDVKLKIRINKPAKEIFLFTTNPESTPKWIDSVVEESSEKYPPEVGTIYRNQEESGKTNEYCVTRYEPYEVFQLEATHADYKLRYTYTPLSDSETELEYYEWSESGQLHSPSMQEILEKLKRVMESI